jgi:hypothetical protein
MSGGAVPPPLSKSTSTADEQRRTSVCGAVMAAQFGKRLGARAKKARYREILQTFPAYRDVAGLIELVEWAKQARPPTPTRLLLPITPECSHPCSPPCSPPPQQIQFRDAEVQKAVKVEPLARVMHLQPCEEGEVVVLQVQGGCRAPPLSQLGVALCDDEMHRAAGRRGRRLLRRLLRRGLHLRRLCTRQGGRAAANRPLLDPCGVAALRPAH